MNVVFRVVILSAIVSICAGQATSSASYSNDDATDGGSTESSRNYEEEEGTTESMKSTNSAEEESISTVRKKNSIQSETWMSTSPQSTESPTTSESFPSDTTAKTYTLSINVISVTDRNLAISWDSPLSDLQYRVTLDSSGPNHNIPGDCVRAPSVRIENTTQQDSYFFDSLMPDYNYVATVSTIVENQSISDIMNFTTDTAAPGIPRNVSATDCGDEFCSTMVLKWEIPCDPNGEIDHYVIEYQGMNMLHNETILNGKNTTTSSNISLTKLLPSTKYTVNLSAVGTNGEKGLPASYEFITKHIIPKAPIVSIDEVSSLGFRVSWKLDPWEQAEITKFNLVIQPLHPGYPMKQNCSQNLPTIHENDLGKDETSFLYQEALPYYNYNVSVVAFSSLRVFSEEGVQLVLTNSATPAPPEHLQLDINETTMAATLSWKLPCNINGPLDYVKAEIAGTYSENASDSTEFVGNSTMSWEDYEYLNITDLRESFDYIATVTIILKDGTIGEQAITNGTTMAGRKPRNLTQTHISDSSFSMEWEPPVERKGKILFYETDISAGNPLYYIPHDCGGNYQPITMETSTTDITFFEAKAHHSYDVAVRAKTERGYGEPYQYSLSTRQSNPGDIKSLDHKITTDNKSEEYNAFVTIYVQRPCYTNGPLRNVSLHYTGTRRDLNQIKGSDILKIEDTKREENYTLKFGLKPEYDYIYEVSVGNDFYISRTTNRTFKSPSGVPIFSPPTDYLPISKVGTEKAEIVLERDLLNHTNGDIKYVALIVATRNSTGGDFQFWDGENWPILDDTGFEQITPNYWNPFQDTTMDSVTFVIGNDTNRNRPLEPNKEYYLIVRLFTRNFYRNSPTYKFQTGKLIGVGVIVGIIFGLLGFVIIGIVAFFVWKKKILRNKIGIFLRRASEKSVESNTSIPCGRFVQYCIHLENNPEKMKEQYNLIVEKAKAIAEEKTTEFAILPENRRKNRYTNISPFDDSRVKLLIDEDDEIGSDYINASFIKGFSGQVEYIASQGPLEATCRDFWKMVLQENVTIIVMVTQFSENNKTKCHHYFPNNHENMVISDDMEVRCATELHFGTYCVRNLQVKKDNIQVTVTHMQFLDWPDFGVPIGTENMLQFCYQLRDRVKIEGGIILVHCSAGVGRTGTLIATDILLQCINSGRQVDIFNTVLELRKQRIFMVQTEKQYIYIHSLLRDHLDRPSSPEEMENDDPVYENMDIIKQSEIQESNSKWKEEESEF